jgi:hypothetical protein
MGYFNDKYKQEMLEQTRQVLEKNTEDQITILRQSRYHIAKISNRRYAVVKVMGWSNANDGIPGHLVFHAVVGLERVEYVTACFAVKDLNLRLKTEDDYRC